MRSNYIILKVAWKLDIAFSQKMTFWVKIEREGAFQDFSHVFFHSLFKSLQLWRWSQVWSAQEILTFYHNYFGRSTHLNVLAMLLYKCTGVNKLFSCTIQWGIQFNVLMSVNERCSQTTTDKMLKFLEQVDIGFIFKTNNFKIEKGIKLAKNLEKRPHTKFWPKTSIFEKTQCPSFMQPPKIGTLTSFTYI